MLSLVVLFFLVCAIGAVILLGKRTLTQRYGKDLDLALDRQNLATRYSFGEFSSEEYRANLARLGSPSTFP